jgi:3-hydroxy-9,10-secoandrosta-1,3,5(10)-triene-9,17-dione monooxygenase reductase component
MALSAAAHVRAPSDTSGFREALGTFATGVAFVTAAPDGEPEGLIVNSFTSVSLDPPLVAFCPARSSFTWQRMRRTGRFGVNVLAQTHEEFARRATPAGAERFAGIDWKPGRRGVPVLTDALATLECEIVTETAAGDHWIVVGHVDAIRTHPGGRPLIFFAGAFGASDSGSPSSRGTS